MDEFILELKNITKRFPGVLALNDVSFDLKRGEVHALVGENGAGKSTLIKIITGAHEPTDGEMILDGHVITKNDPIKSQKNGVATIYQELNLMPAMSVMDNVFMGQEMTRRSLFLDKKKMLDICNDVIGQLGVEINPRSLIRDLSVAYQQLVEIAKVLFTESKVLIMDEPTAPLTENEVEILFKIIRKLKEKGVSIIYISHKLDEVFQLSDRVTVLRDGEHISTMQTSEATKDELIKLMIGRELGDQYPPHSPDIGEPILQIEELTNNRVRNISFELKKGEVLGIAGLVGSGRTEMARAIFGADSKQNGKIKLKGGEISIKSPLDAIKCGIGFITEDRKRQGLLLNQTIRLNMTFSSLSNEKGAFINKKKESTLCEDLWQKLSVRGYSLMQKVVSLSGGNQQKVVLAKWLATNSEILIFDEPTRGIDVGAKREIYTLMSQMVSEGRSIIMISSEMPELIGMSDRIIVFREGEIVGQLTGDEITQERILKMAANY